MICVFLFLADRGEFFSLHLQGAKDFLAAQTGCKRKKSVIKRAQNDQLISLIKFTLALKSPMI